MSIQLLSVIPPQLFDKLQSSHFPVVPHTTHLSSTKFITRFAFTSQTETTEPPPPPPPPPTRGGWRRTKSYLAREAAILQLKQSSDLTSSLQSVGDILKVQDLNLILRHFGSQRRWHDLSQLFEWMQQHGKTNVSSYSSYIKFLGKSVKPLKALEFYDSITDESIKNNVFICNSILACLVRNEKFDISIKLFHKMKQNGLTPDAVSYNTLLSGCIKAKHGYPTALELVKELKFCGLPMDGVMYGILLAVCASNNMFEEAQCYFDQMKNEGHPPNLYHYSALLNACSSDGNYKKADELVQEMRSIGLVPNKVILTTMLKVYVRGGLFEKSRELLAELDASGYAEDEMPYCVLMDGLSKAGYLDEARAIFRELQEKRVKSDGYAHSIMISAFCRRGLFDEAKQLAEELQTEFDKYDLVLLNTMLCAYCRVGEMDNVKHVMRKMDELGISPDYNTFNILIKYFCKEKLYLLAYRTMEDLYGKGHKPEEELCSSLIYHLGRMKAYAEAFSVYSMLKYSKRTMCKTLHEKILYILISGRLLKDAYIVVKDNAGSISHPAIKKFASVYIRFGNINSANDVMKIIHTSGFKIDQELFHMLISRYIAEPEKKELLIQLLHWMAGHGYIVDSSTRNLILKNSDLFGRQVIADVLSKHHMMRKFSTR